MTFADVLDRHIGELCVVVIVLGMLFLMGKD